MTRYGWMALLPLVFSCGPAGPTMPEPPSGFDAERFVEADGKPDSLTRWLTTVKGSIGFNGSTQGKTSAGEWFHGYTFNLQAGDEVAVKAHGDYYGLVRIYGPQSASGSWGWARASEWITYVSSEQVFRGEITSFTAPSSGTYLLVVGSPWDPSYAYDLNLGCPSGQCGDAFCVIYETTDPDGNPLQNFYATDVSSYAAGKQLLAQVGSFVNEDILTGSCAEVQMACPKVYLPVCGDSPGYPKQTFGNVCDFKVYVIGIAGSTGDAKGHWESGACVTTCTYDGTEYLPGDSFPAADGCNTCSCGANGMVGCTKMACTCDPKVEWWRKYAATDPATCAVLKFYCQPNTLYFANACGCGCEQSSDCEQYYDCEPPTDCSAVQAKCPYSTFGL